MPKNPKETDAILTPSGAILEARKALPIFKYLLGTMGLLGIAAIVTTWKVSKEDAIQWAVVLVFISLILWMFHKFAPKANVVKVDLAGPIKIIIYVVTGIFCITLIAVTYYSLIRLSNSRPNVLSRLKITHCTINNSRIIIGLKAENVTISKIRLQIDKSFEFYKCVQPEVVRERYGSLPGIDSSIDYISGRMKLRNFDKGATGETLLDIPIKEEEYFTLAIKLEGIVDNFSRSVYESEFRSGIITIYNDESEEVFKGETLFNIYGRGGNFRFLFPESDSDLKVLNKEWAHNKAMIKKIETSGIQYRDENTLEILTRFKDRVVSVNAGRYGYRHYLGSDDDTTISYDQEKLKTKVPVDEGPIEEIPVTERPVK